MFSVTSPGRKKHMLVAAQVSFVEFRDATPANLYQ